MGKLSTPDWILKGKEKPKEKETSKKTFNLRRCPKCNSDNVKVVLTEGLESEILSDSSEESQVKEGKGTKEWECKKCKWHGKNIEKQELNEEQFMKYLDENGVEVS
jgi:ribosomal protein L37AE/L43A